MPHATLAGIALLVALGLTVEARAGQVSSGKARKRPPGQVLVPAGPFTMGNDPGVGNPDEHPAHRPTLGGFSIDRHEVTNREFGACVEQGACSPPASRDSKTRRDYFGHPRFADHPVVNVDWYQAADYCRWVGGRLPTEAEWEKAARGDRDRRQYPWGDRKPDCSLANFGGPDGCSGDTDRVGARPAGASPYGAMDMAGNVWEWVADWYDSAYYKTSPARDPRGPRWGAFKVMRGGCFDTAAEGLRVSCRNRDLPSGRGPNVGFRCARPRGGRR